MVEATLVPGASVARVARDHGVNANQVFAWRKAFKEGLLEECGVGGVKLLPVRVAGSDAIEPVSPPKVSAPRSSGAIHLEFPGKALVTVEGPDLSARRTDGHGCDLPVHTPSRTLDDCALKFYGSPHAAMFNEFCRDDRRVRCDMGRTPATSALRSLRPRDQILRG